MNPLPPPPKVLIFLLSGIGDTLMFTPALRLLRTAWHSSHLVALAMKPSERDTLLYNPDLDEVRFWPFLQKHWWSNLAFLAGLRKEGFDLTILPCPANRIYYNLISFLAGAPHRASFRYLQQSRCNLDFLNTVLFPHVDNVHNAEHNLVLVEQLTGVRRDVAAGWTPALALPTVESDRRDARLFLESARLTGKDCVGLHIDSSRAKHMERKCWPREYYLELIQRLLTRHPSLSFVLFCGEDDLPESEWLQIRAGDCLRVASQLPIRTVAEIIRSGRVFISNDAGLAHVSCAVGTPTVVVFGPTNPLRTGPWNATAEIVRTGLPCSPCFYHTSRDLTCPSNLDFACLRDLPIAAVLDAVERFLQLSRA